MKKYILIILFSTIGIICYGQFLKLETQGNKLIITEDKEAIPDYEIVITHVVYKNGKEGYYCYSKQLGKNAKNKPPIDPFTMAEAGKWLINFATPPELLKSLEKENVK